MNTIIRDEHNSKIIDRLLEIKQWIDDWTYKKNLVFLWDVWVGKTYLAKTIFNSHYLVKEAEIKVLLSSNLLKRCPPEIFPIPYPKYPLEALLKKQHIIYDDLWVAWFTESYIEKALYWLDEREDWNKQTIFTTNFWIQELERHEKRIQSRVFRNADIVLLKWPDRRRSSRPEIIS